MKVETWPVERITPYEKNPRKNAGAVAKVSASLREFGFRQPIVVDGGGVIVVGHTRFLAAMELGLTEVPVHVATGLSPAQIRAYRIADNRTNEEAEWNDALLAVELEDLKDAGYDLALTGLDPDEIVELVGAASVGLTGDLDEAPDPPEKAITQPGDLIVLGRHRLLCGDSTAPDSWKRLLGEKRAGMVWTDPPYGVSYVGKTKDALTIDNDSLGEKDLREFLRAAFTVALEHTRPGGAWYVASPAGPLQRIFDNLLTDLKVRRQCLTWVKDQFVLGRSDYHYRHEPIFYGWKEGAPHTWNGGRDKDSVLEVARPRANKEHPTMKPVDLIRTCIENSARADDLVVDPFGGSGSTLIAAEAAGRASALIELSPGYCDVIVARWEGVTGKKAKRPERAKATRTQ